VDPLQKRWAEVKQRVNKMLDAERTEESARNQKQIRLRVVRQSEKLLSAWIDELASIRVLDPACGSGNFLYVALRRLLDLWLEARNFAVEQAIFLVSKMVSPSQLYGIETDFYAHELASIVVWIGFLQWKYEHCVLENREPVLQKLTNIEHTDAILRYDMQTKQPYEPSWPRADFIVGNPPFLGGNRLREELPGGYVDALQHLYRGRISAAAALVTYWFEKSRALIPENDKLRVGLLATQSIRGGVNRRVLERIKKTGDLFMAWSDRPWLLEGAVVRVSMIGFDYGKEGHRVLNGIPVTRINADLTSAVDTTSVVALKENVKLCFRTDEKGGPFEVRPEVAQKMLLAPTNVNNRPNSDVICRWINATDVAARDRGLWIIDFHHLDERQAEQYEWPFETLKKQIADE
jgi:type II restriction/modification system DNA methylase subunit YeeA